MIVTVGPDESYLLFGSFVGDPSPTRLLVIKFLSIGARPLSSHSLVKGYPL